MRPSIASFAAAIVLTLAAPVRSQEIEPRAYSNAPEGVNFFIAAVAYSAGGVSLDPALPVENAHLRTRSSVIAYARTLNLGGKSAKLDVALPYARTRGSAEFEGQLRERDVSGLADARLRLSVSFLGAPALSLAEFAKYRQKTIVGASLQVTVPTGQYDPDRLVNNGTNRWSFKPELGVSRAWKAWTVELAAAATLFTDNNDFFGGRHREQDPIYSAQGSVIFSSRSGIWFAASGTFFRGGRTTVDSVRKDDLLENSRAALTVAFPVNRHNSVKVFLNSGVSTRTGSDFDLYSVAWQHRWGAGL